MDKPKQPRRSRAGGRRRRRLRREGGADQNDVRVPAEEEKPAIPTPPDRREPTPPVECSSSGKRILPRRADHGTSGRATVVKANHFGVDLSETAPNPHIYHVEISPEVKLETTRKKIMKLLISSYGVSHLGNLYLRYDGRKGAFTAGPLPFELNEFVVDCEGISFRVTIKFVAETDLCHLREFLSGNQPDRPQQAIQSLNKAMWESAYNRHEGHAIVDRSLFSPQVGEQGEPSDGVRFLKGFYQSLRPLHMGLSLYMDTSTQAFYEPILVSEFVRKFLNKDTLEQPLVREEHLRVKRILEGVKVQSNHLGYPKLSKVLDLTNDPIEKLMFIDCNGNDTSVIDYFKNKHDIDLQFKCLPAIIFGTKANPKYLPMEVCCLANCQRYAHRLNENQVKTLITAKHEGPMQREENIRKAMESNDYFKDDFLNNQYDMRVGEQLTTIDARVLSPPSLKYRDEKKVKPQAGQWNMIEQKMFIGGSVTDWALVNFSKLDEGKISDFWDKLTGVFKEKGMDYHLGPVGGFNTGQAEDIERVLEDVHTRCRELLKGKHVKLLFVILPEHDKEAYGTIKRVCETKLGIVSQCVKAKNILHFNNRSLTNLALKINIKVGGTNCVLSPSADCPSKYLSEHSTIVFGGDVTHPLSGESSAPSIAAVVASMDWPAVSGYNTLCRAQSPRQEIIQDLYTTYTDSGGCVVEGGMIREHLASFKTAHGKLPDRVIFYRDGVGEEQFNEVLEKELDQVKKGCLSMKKDDYNPKITYVVVQKRHHTRLFPEKYGDPATSHESGNILPGTVVDTKICHPTEFDFYLCSHAVKEGTIRPAHYHVLHDENNFTADELQNLTNSLCYTFARCTKSVSIVPPIHYADMAAYRSRFYLKEDSHTAIGGDRVAAAVQPLPDVHENVKGVMFYC